MASRQADRLEMFEALRETFGDKVTETLLEEFLTRDHEVAAMRDDIRGLGARVDLLTARSEIRFDALDKRLDTIENWIRVMVLGFLGFASTTIFLALQLH